MTTEIEAKLIDMGLDKDNLSGINLSKTDFSGLDLSGLDFTGSNLDECNFRHAAMVGTILNSASMRGADFEGANLEGALIKRVTHQWSNMKNLSLVDAHMTNSDFTGADFGGSDLSGAIFDSTTLIDASLKGVPLVNASFIGADLTAANFFKADMTGADLTRTKYQSIDKVKGRHWETIFIATDLTDAKMIACSFHSTNFTHAILTNTDFDKSTFSNCPNNPQMIAEKEQLLKDLMTELVQRYFGEGSGYNFIDEDWQVTDKDMKTIIAVREATGLTFGGAVKYKCAIDSNTKRVVHKSYSINFGEAYFAEDVDALAYYLEKFGTHYQTWEQLEEAMEAAVDEKGHSTFAGGFCTYGIGNLVYA